MKRAACWSGLLGVWMLLVGLPPARAGLITVEPDAFPGGTDLSTAFPGVTLVAMGQDDLSVYSLEESPADLSFASTPTRVFGNAGYFPQWDPDVRRPWEWGTPFNAGLRIEFARPVSFVAIDMIANDRFDLGRLIPYNSLGIELPCDTCLTGVLSVDPGAVLFETAFISRPGGDIAFVVATGDEQTASSVNLDHLRYQVPEPGTLLLLGSGLILLGLLRRRGREG